MNDGERDALLIRLDERLANILEKMDTQDKRLDAHAANIKSLEGWRNKFLGLASVVGAKEAYAIVSTALGIK